MEFAEKHKEIIQKVSPKLPTLYWTDTIIFSLVIFLVLNVYFFYYEQYYGIDTFNKALADTAVILIGLSFALSGICYFWDFADTKIIYRKYLGVVGFAYAFLHGGISVAFYLYDLLITDLTFYGLRYDLLGERVIGGLVVSNLYSFSFGLLGLLVFTVLAAVANKYAATQLGGRLWRVLLRTGYIGLFFILIHFGLRDIRAWNSWYESIFKGGTLLPSVSLVAAVLIILVFLLRIALELGLRMKRKNNSEKVKKDKKRNLK